VESSEEIKDLDNYLDDEIKNSTNPEEKEKLKAM